MALGLGLGATFGGGIPSLAAMLLAAETDGLAADFTDMSMMVKDTATPANAFSGDPNSKLTYSSPSTKWILGSNGLYSSGTTMRTEYSAAGVPLGCRIEEARTNLALRSQDFATTWLATNTAVTANTTVAPDGTTTADTITLNNSGGQNIRQNITVSASTTYTFSFFAMRGTATDATYSVFDVSNGANIVAPTSYYAQTNSSTFTRIVVTFTTPVGCTSINIYPLRDTVTANGTTIILWQGQLEAGAFETSIIPTAGSTVTRAADNISIASSLFPYSATASTLFAVWDRTTATAGNTQRAVQLDNSSTTNRAFVGSNTTANVLGSIDSGGVNQAGWTVAGLTVNGRRLAALGLTANDANLAVNGAIQSQDTSVTMPASVNRLMVGSADGSTANTIINGWVRQIMYLPRRMTDPQLVTVTT